MKEAALVDRNSAGFISDRQICKSGRTHAEVNQFISEIAGRVLKDGQSFQWERDFARNGIRWKVVSENDPQ